MTPNGWRRLAAQWREVALEWAMFCDLVLATECNAKAAECERTALALEAE